MEEDTKLSRMRAAFEEEYERLNRENRNLLREIRDLRAASRGELWFWEDEGENHLTSLTCPVQISSQALRDLLAQEYERGRSDTLAKIVRHSLLFDNKLASEVEDVVS